MCVINGADEGEITMAFCSKCGTEREADEAFCKSCGQNLFDSQATVSTPPATSSKKPKSPVVALVLAILILPLGHIYVGKTARGLGLFFLTLILITMSFSLELSVAGSEWITILLFILPLYIWYDAYKQAVKHNESLAKSKN